MKTFLSFVALGVVLFFALFAATAPPAHAQSQITNFTNGLTTWCVLDGGSPAQCEAPITRGAKCVAQIEGTSAATASAGAAVSYPLLADGGVSTLVRFTSADSSTATVRGICNK